jgi:hypothetical protein
VFCEVSNAAENSEAAHPKHSMLIEEVNLPSCGTGHYYLQVINKRRAVGTSHLFRFFFLFKSLLVCEVCTWPKIFIVLMSVDGSRNICTSFIWLNGRFFMYSKYDIICDWQSVWRWVTDWMIGVPVFDSRWGLGIFIFTTASRMALGPIQPPI